MTTRIVVASALLVVGLSTSIAAADVKLWPRGPIDVEAPVLRDDFSDPTHPITTAAVMGVRRVEAIDATHVRMTIGPAYNHADGDGNASGYGIYSPDDAAYAFDAFVQPLAAATVDQDDVAAPVGPQASLVKKHVVTLTLPTPMVKGSTYYVRAIGGRKGTQGANHYRAPWNGSPITSGANAAHFRYGDATNPSDGLTDDVVRSVLGMRAVNVVAPDHLRLTFGGDTAIADDVAPYTITSTDDADFAGDVHPLALGRRSGSEFYIPGGGWPYPQKLAKHELYLRLAHALKEGKHYTVSVPASVTGGRRSIAFEYRDLEMPNPHLKVNQEGYRPESVKWGFLGAWMGTLGTLDYSSAKSFSVVDAQTKTVVLTGAPALRGKASSWKEGGGGANTTREDVYVCDFSALKTPGEYFLVVPGMGRSDRFRIAIDAYRPAFEVAMRGLLFQRAGQALDGTHSHFRNVAGHVQPPVETPYMGAKVIVGGHYDAGDFNPRSHYDVAHLLMLAYELTPAKFYDGQLDVPERDNGVPDIVDEAAWEIRPWLELQDPTDGGLGDQDGFRAIESPGDPSFVEPAERDPLRQISFAKNASASFHLAAMAATASRIYRTLGKTSEADTHLAAARRAYDFAKAHDPKSALDAFAWAAAELAHTTGEAGFTADFTSSGYTFTGAASDGEDDKMRGAIAYALNQHPSADASLRDRMRTALVALADLWIADGASWAYPHVQHPYQPLSWGAGAYPGRLLPVSIAHHLTGDAKYLAWHVHTCDLGLGANPLGLTYVTGLGDHPINGPLHLFGFHNYQGRMPPGLQSEGPVNDATFGAWEADAVPRLADMPDGYQYFDTRYLPGTQEGVVTNMAKTAIAYAMLLPDVSELPAPGAVDPGGDAAPGADSGGPGGSSDAGPGSDGGANADATDGSSPSSCSCSTIGAHAPSHAGLALCGLLVTALAMRRRPRPRGAKVRCLR